jgi:NAD(P)-dependent dehydrogenase (short-subunit alcohol dehydrogenase family)
MLRKHVFSTIRRFSTAQAKQVYLVVGANGGIGSSLTEQLLLSSDSVNVAVACRSADAMNQLVQKLADGPAGKGAADRILQVKLDATIPGSH